MVSRSFKHLSLVVGLLSCATAFAQSAKYSGVGRAPSATEIKDWDISVGPSGKELPPGSGTAKQGAPIYAAKCAGCHGVDLMDGKGGPRLRGGEGTLTSLRIERSIGSYWGFATTVWDFINRDMPPTPVRGTLTHEEVYALTAFILSKNNIIKEDEVMDAKSLPRVKMPNREGYVPFNPVYKKDAVRPHGSY
ncbi:MAG: cytochrome c [Bryobacterales bacterium]|nr:cytochrome c [Bryobacterales bacterium]